jgi:hypothetical protein
MRLWPGACGRTHAVDFRAHLATAFNDRARLRIACFDEMFDHVHRAPYARSDQSPVADGTPAAGLALSNPPLRTGSLLALRLAIAHAGKKPLTCGRNVDQPTIAQARVRKPILHPPQNRARVALHFFGELVEVDIIVE